VTAPYPRARIQGLEANPVDDELVVYDSHSDHAHALNRVSAAVWKRCNGLTSPEAIAAAVSVELGQTMTVELVAMAVDQLEQAQLLEAVLAVPNQAPRLSRRQIARGVVAAAILVPVVWTVLAPTPAQAASTGCTPAGGPCGNCCPGTECNGIICM
jgi:hypothetical protein